MAERALGVSIEEIEKLFDNAREKRYHLHTMMIETHSSEETQALAKKILIDARERSSGRASVIALEGELGAGKTTLTQAIARELGVQDLIKSPTFVLMKQYTVPGGTLYHLDCYRLKDEKDCETLGLVALFDNPANTLIIEWADRVRNILPPHRLTVRIDHVHETTRSITII